MSSYVLNIWVLIYCSLRLLTINGPLGLVGHKYRGHGHNREIKRATVRKLKHSSANNIDWPRLFFCTCGYLLESLGSHRMVTCAWSRRDPGTDIITTPVSLLAPVRTSVGTNFNKTVYWGYMFGTREGRLWPISNCMVHDSRKTGTGTGLSILLFFFTEWVLFSMQKSQVFFSWFERDDSLLTWRFPWAVGVIITHPFTRFLPSPCEKTW